MFFNIVNLGDIPLSAQETETVSRHLLDRLAEIGINHLFGVPGDYNPYFWMRSPHIPKSDGSAMPMS